MKWNWQQSDWPNFSYNPSDLSTKESKFLINAGFMFGVYHHIKEANKNNFLVDIISNEAIKTSEIEGEYLDRDSVQASLRFQLGLSTSVTKKVTLSEQGIVDMMVDLYQNFATPLTHEILFSWHKMLMRGRTDFAQVGVYRQHEDPMQIVSGYLHDPKVHYEALPSSHVLHEMDNFIRWFKDTSPSGATPLPALTRAAIAHWYFVCIHPFEDGNGRIARALAEKSLSQYLSHPTLISLSTLIEKNRKEYYSILEKSNRTNEIALYLDYFSTLILDAQEYTQKKVSFLIEKTKFYDEMRDKLNPRQEKALERMFREGLEGFLGGLSAEKYIRLTRCSRATATRDLNDLVEKGALIKIGERKSTRYFLDIKSLLTNCGPS
jgi:Fic family protein